MDTQKPRTDTDCEFKQGRPWNKTQEEGREEQERQQGIDGADGLVLQGNRSAWQRWRGALVKLQLSETSGLSVPACLTHCDAADRASILLLKTFVGGSKSPTSERCEHVK